MKSNSPDQHQTNLYRPVLKQLINPRDALALLADKIPWKELKKTLNNTVLWLIMKSVNQLQLIVTIDLKLSC